MLRTWVFVLAFNLSLSAQASTLFEDLGGRDKIAAFTDDFVERLIRDDRVRHFFDETDLPRFKARLTDQFCHLSGEKKRYRGANMKNAHADLGIQVGHFNAIVEDLQLAMDDSEIGFATQNRLLAVLAPLERDIVNK